MLEGEKAIISAYISEINRMTRYIEVLCNIIMHGDTDNDNEDDNDD